jgi:hypothetical protein
MRWLIGYMDILRLIRIIVALDLPLAIISALVIPNSIKPQELTQKEVHYMKYYPWVLISQGSELNRFRFLPPCKNFRSLLLSNFLIHLWPH